MNLWVDDIRPAPKEGNWIWAKTVGQATRLIAHNKFTIISLDHDDAYSEDGFMPLVYVIGLAYQDRWPDDFEVIIHSMNPVGAQNMAQAFISEYNLHPRIVPYRS